MATLPFHYQFQPAQPYANFGMRKYVTFDAMIGEIAWLLGVDERDVRHIDNSDIGDGDHDDDLAVGGTVVGSFWRCPFPAPVRADASIAT